MPQEFYTLLNFIFIMIYKIHKIFILLKNHLNYCKDRILKRLFEKCKKTFIFYIKLIFFRIYKDEKFKA